MDNANSLQPSILAGCDSMLVASLAILAIGAWIGWTMATTPPPKPIQEIETQKMES